MADSVLMLLLACAGPQGTSQKSPASFTKKLKLWKKKPASEKAVVAAPPVCTAPPDPLEEAAYTSCAFFLQNCSDCSNTLVPCTLIMRMALPHSKNFKIRVTVNCS